MLRMVGEAGAHSRLSAIDATKRPVMSMIVLTYHGTVRSRTVISMRLGRLGTQADLVDAQIAPTVLKRLRECLCAPHHGGERRRTTSSPRSPRRMACWLPDLRPRPGWSQARSWRRRNAHP